MNGAAARRKGHTAERAVARWLRDHGWPDAETTRAKLGHDGARQPGDIDGVPGVALEVKDHGRLCIPEWLRQVEEEAGPNLPVLVVKERGSADPGRWWAVLRLEDLSGLLVEDVVQ